MSDVIAWPGGEWKTIRIIGKGGYGAVYEIQRESFGKIYKAAMKVMRIPKDDSEIELMRDEGMTENEISQYYTDYVKRISEEFALLSTLKGYTNIVSYEDHKLIRNPNGIGWTILIRMELLKPAKQYFSECRYGEQTVVKLGTDICRALEICHSKKIIHRDIKLDNIFVNGRGDFELGDFGIARITEKSMATMTVTGTPGYMAPEIYRNQRYGQNVDIYSLGIAMYMLLNKMRGPFYPLDRRINPEDREKALNERISGAPIPFPIHGSEELKAIVLKAIAYNPEERFQSAEDLRKALCGEYKINPYEDAYHRAVNMEGSASTWEAYAKAESAFLLLGDYKDCPERSVRCHKTAERLWQDSGNEQEKKAEENKPELPPVLISEKKGKKKRGLIAGAAAVSIMILAGVALFMINKSNDFGNNVGDDSSALTEVMDSGETEVPAETPLPSETPLPTETPTPKVIAIDNISQAEAGDIVQFGQYEQDNDPGNGIEEIEWMVLGEVDGQVLLISKEILDAVPYNRTETDVTWENSFVREWLNGEFLNSAFSEDEEKRIVLTHLINENTGGTYWKSLNREFVFKPEGIEAEAVSFETDGGNETDDRVFCLSIKEAEQYFASDKERIGFPTPYAAGNKKLNLSEGASWWWLRSPGTYGYYAANVRPDGSLLISGRSAACSTIGVRPALWVNKENR